MLATQRSRSDNYRVEVRARHLDTAFAPRSHRIGAVLLLVLFLHSVGWQIVGFHNSTDCDLHFETQSSSTVEKVDHRHTHHEECSICRMQRQISDAEPVSLIPETPFSGTSFRVVSSSGPSRAYTSADAVAGIGRGPPYFVFA